MSPDDTRPICERFAQLWGVSPDVHPDDLIFRFLLENPTFETPDHSVEYYFRNGAQSARTLLTLLTQICGIGEGKFELLEFASGYGCVTRHLRKVIPGCSLTACDIHPQAIEFLREKLDVEAVLSASRPEELRLEHRYDVVFALSFFSHMPKRSFLQWLARLASFTTPGGFLLFTTHGLESQQHFPRCRFDRDGFYFEPSSEQKDLDASEYGSAVVRPEYVVRAVSKTPGLTLKLFSQAHWWQHQDVYIAQATPEREHGTAGPSRSFWRRRG
jgi:hypothetical protein